TFTKTLPFKIISKLLDNTHFISSIIICLLNSNRGKGILKITLKGLLVLMKRIWFIPVVLLLSCCNITILNPKSATGEDQAFLIRLSLIIMSVVVVTVFVLLVWFINKYRKSNLEEGYIPSDVSGNKKLETTWTLIPIMLLAILAVPTIGITYYQSP